MRGRPGIGQLRPRGIAAKVPRSTTGMSGTCFITDSWAGPSRRVCIHPSSLRVPSGNSSRLHLSSSSSRAMLERRRDPYRSTGNALKTNAVTAARHRASKK